MSDSSTISLSSLLAGADAAGHDHAVNDRNSGLQHIHNRATGAVVWFPTWQKFRQTRDWTQAVAGQEALLTEATSAGTSLNDATSTLLAQQLESLLERAAGAADANEFIQENLTPHLTGTWALADAAAKAAGAELPHGKAPAGFEDYPYDVYAQDGGAFATALWNDIVDARRNRALADEAARKALKPVSRKALKNAARKAARR
ncbi:hypothetical protein V1639_07000 [Pseudarthrobacter sp. J75]|uniref:hypothetical protein n=1 Tax=Pseudarthrobacter sp. J75 TaxID=3116486 RepID=UPI002E824A86|nr:hypothetical protein [Pseudarthrobacter sp. J75]MEE2528776.1 hypothetical protein [Pseudarthrobacter sp. J75]